MTDQDLEAKKQALLQLQQMGMLNRGDDSMGDQILDQTESPEDKLKRALNGQMRDQQLKNALTPNQ